MGEIRRTIAPPKGASEEKKTEFYDQQVDLLKDFNRATYEFTKGIHTQDTESVISRRKTMSWVILFTIVAGFGLALAAILSSNTAVAVASTAVLAAILAIATFVNPLQTIERDSIYRRWSDTILAGFYLQVANSETDLDDIRRAIRQANTEFATLAVTHRRVARSAIEGIQAIGMASVGKPGTDEEETAELATEITMSTPAIGKTPVDNTIKDVTIKVTGPEGTVVESTGHPTGLEFKDGTFTGTPTEAKTFTVTVVATHADSGKEAAVTFPWEVSAAEGST